jgi:mannose-6-phosphate isomerase-like protein (cupin superfamily)
LESKVVGPGEGELLDLGPSRSTVKAGVDDGMGSLAVLESTVQAGFPGPVLHLHEQMVDSFYVQEGTLTLQVDGIAIEAKARTYALVPPGNPHTFSNPSDEPVSVLNVMAPAGFEGYLREVAAEAGPLDPQRMAEIASKYDFRAI